MEISLLGDLQAWHEGKQIELGGHRQRCVLAVLLLDPGHVVSVERIVSRAWSDDLPKTAANLVTSYISRLRRSFGPAGGQFDLVSRRPGYFAQVDADRVDLHRFTRLTQQARQDQADLDGAQAAARLREALALWHGTALADLDSPWLAEQRSRLEKLRLDAAELLAEIEIDAGHADGIVPLLRELAEANPHRERLTMLAVHALTTLGEPSQAVDLAARTIRALREHGLNPGPALQQAQLAALRSGSGSVPYRLRTATGRAQLPPDTSAFIGREPEMEELATAVRDGQAAGSVVVVTIQGMTGIGKTAFAVHAAHHLSSQFPDGQLFIDLHGFTPNAEPIKPTVALDRMLRALGVAPQAIPEDPEEQAALYRDRLSATRTLIVLDNALSESQIRPLLPGSPGCLVLITSRRRLTALDDAHAIPLDVLPDSDATALFTVIAGPGRISPGDPAVAQTIALCGRIPLAVRIAAARLRNRPTWNAQYLVTRLSDEARRLPQLEDGDRSLNVTLTVSYDHLTAEEQRIFRHLGRYPGTDIDVYGAAALTGDPVETADMLLEALYDHNLLAQRTIGRYQLHDLVRIYARDCSETEPPEHHAKALLRLLNYYLYMARTADQQLAYRTVDYTSPPVNDPNAMPVLESDIQAVSWIEVERINLTAAVEAAHANGFRQYAMAIPTAMHSALRTQGHWGMAHKLHKISLAAAQGLGDERGVANAMCCIADIQMVNAQYGSALETLEPAIELYRTKGDPLGEANALLALARVHRMTAHIAMSLQTLRLALGLYDELEDALGRANALTTLSDLFKITGQYDDAQTALDEALELYDRIGHRHGQAQAFTDLGEVQLRTGQIQQAECTLRRALDTYRQLGNRLDEARALTLLGGVQEQLSQYSEAEDSLRRALQLYRHQRNRRGQAEALIALGSVQNAVHRGPEAYETLLQAIEICREADHRLGLANALMLTAKALRAMNRQSEAADNHRQALELYRQIEIDL